MRKKIISALSFIALISLAWCIVWIFFGKYEITATIDGSQISTPVSVDGEFKCRTPCHFRLMPGYHTIKVERPEGFEIASSDKILEDTGVAHVLTAGRGMDFSPDFSSNRK